jgi:hypothetical protein
VAECSKARAVACCIAGSNSAWNKDVCCEWCVLSGSGLCDGPIPRTEESYRL